MRLSRDLREFVGSLNANSVRYLIVGGYAVAFHGHPRYTKDLDVWIEPTRENAEKVVRALDEFGFGNVGLSVDDFTADDQIIQLGNPPLRIDLLTAVPGVDFGECFAARTTVSVDEVSVDFINLDHLRISKRASGRFQDLADLENLA